MSPIWTVQAVLTSPSESVVIPLYQDFHKSSGSDLGRRNNVQSSFFGIFLGWPMRAACCGRRRWQVSTANLDSRVGRTVAPEPLQVVMLLDFGPWSNRRIDVRVDYG